MYHQLFQARSLLVPTVKVLRPKYHQSFLVPPAFSRTTSFSKDNQRLFEDQQFFNKKPMSPQLKYLLSFQVPPMFFKRTTSFFKIKYDHSFQGRMAFRGPPAFPRTTNPCATSPSTTSPSTTILIKYVYICCI